MQLTPTPSREDGSTLLLFPFGVLVLLLLGAITLDAAVVFRADRVAIDETAALADDIAGVLDAAAFAAGEGVRIDTEAARRLVDAANDRLAPGLRCTAQPVGTSVEVTCSGTVRPVLLPALGGRQGFTIGGTATARAVEAGPPVG